MGSYVVIDLEMCRVPKSMKRRYHYMHEIIQIGAILMNEEYEIIDSFNSYVKPEYGFLDGFIKNLTGISGADIKDAPGIEEALDAFLTWIPEETTAISWSDSDKYQFIHELSEKNIPVPDKLQGLFDTWIDCQPEFSEKMQMSRQYSLEEALIATDICTDGRAHNGLADAQNTALLYAKMKREDKLVLNPYYDRAHNETASEHLSYGLGDLLAAAGFITDDGNESL